MRHTSCPVVTGCQTCALPIFLACGGGQLELHALHARGDGHLALVADVDGTGRIFADQHHGQPRLAPGLGDEGADPVRDLAAKRLRKGLAVDDLADGHDASPCYSIMVESRPEANASPPPLIRSRFSRLASPDSSEIAPRGKSSRSAEHTSELQSLMRLSY